MISKALLYLKNHFNQNIDFTGTGESAAPDKIAFVDGDQMDPIHFTSGAVSMLLINVREERLLRNADPYHSVVGENAAKRHKTIQPDIRLDLYILFVARFKTYDAAWGHLSKIIEYVQQNKSLSAKDEYPGLDQLTFELVTLKFAEQNEIWNALRTTLLPSLLYKVSMIIFRDQGGKEVTAIDKIATTIHHPPLKRDAPAPNPAPPAANPSAT